MRYWLMGSILDNCRNRVKRFMQIRFRRYAEFPDRLRTLHDNLKPGGRLPRPKRAI